MLILGLSCSKHDTAAALFEDGIIKSAIENDKLARSYNSGFPETAMRFCLEQAGATWTDLDAIAVEPQPFHGFQCKSLSGSQSNGSSANRAASRQGRDMVFFRAN